MSDTILRIAQLSKTFADTSIAAVNNISLDIIKGEILALTGPSGAGKTTLLRVLAGLILPDKGTVHYGDELINEYAEELVPGHPDIHLVFQDFKLFPNHTIAENIAYPLKYYDKDVQKERTQELLQLFRLQAFAEKYPRELSGGQQQRVALAKAMAAEPEVLLLDEPFSQIDGMLKHEIKQALQQLVNDYETTLVFVTHDTADALSFAQRIALINQGQLIQTAAPQDIYQKPVSQFVARFFGLCNFLPGNLLPNKLLAAHNSDQVVCIRPEQLKITLSAQAHFSGQVTHQQFMGNYYLLTIAVNSEQNILVQTTTAYLPGTSVGLSILDMHVLRTLISS